MPTLRKASHVLMWILLGLLVLGLAGFGVTSFTALPGVPMKVGDIEISTDTYIQNLNQQLNALQRESGQPIDAQRALDIGLSNRVLSALMVDALLMNEAKTMGLSIGDDAVRRTITALPEFQGVDGAFDAEGYRFVLQRAGLSPRDFERDVKTQIIRQMLTRLLVPAALNTNALATLIIDYTTEKRSFRWAEITADALDITAPHSAPNEQDIETLYQATQDQYTIPETKVITYIWLSPDDFAARQSVPDTNLRNAYKARLDLYQRPASRFVDRLVFANQTEAAQAYADIQNGTTDFDALLALRGITADDVDLGEITADDTTLTPAVRTALFAPETDTTTDVPVITPPVQTSLGVALFRINVAIPAQNQRFEDVRDDLKQELLLDQARRAILDLQAPLEDSLAAGATIEDIAIEQNVPIQTTRYQTTKRDGIAAFPEFRTYAHDLTAVDFPQSVLLSDGGLFIARLDERIDASVQPLAKVKQQVTDAWTRNDIHQQLVQRTESVAQSINDGVTTLQDTANALGLVIKQEIGVGRTDFLADVPSDFIAQAFAIPLQSAQPIAFDNRVYLVVVDEKIADTPAAEDFARLQDAINQDIRNSTNNDILMLYINALQSTTPVVVNQRALDLVHAAMVGGQP